VKLSASANPKYGPNDASFLGHVAIDLEVDNEMLQQPEQLQAQLRLIYAIVQAAAERPAPAAREPGQDDDRRGEDLRPGDRGYRTDDRRSCDEKTNAADAEIDRAEREERYEPGRNDRRDDRQSDRRPPDRGRDDGRRSGGGNRLEGSLPTTGKQLAAWLRNQPQATVARVKRIMTAQDWGWRFVDLYEDDVDFIVRELDRPEPRSHVNGSADGNGRDGGRR